MYRGRSITLRGRILNLNHKTATEVPIFLFAVRFYAEFKIEIKAEESRESEMMHYVRSNVSSLFLLLLI